MTPSFPIPDDGLTLRDVLRAAAHAWEATGDRPRQLRLHPDQESLLLAEAARLMPPASHARILGGRLDELYGMRVAIVPGQDRGRFELG